MAGCWTIHAPLPRCAEPEVHSHTLITEDEFMVVACDGLWDMLSSQRCVEIARQHLRDHNDPQTCAQFLVRTLPPCSQSQTLVPAHVGVHPAP